MKLLFDINHPADVNFFKNTIFELDKKGHEIILIYRSRGKLEKILKYELQGYRIIKVGNHKQGFVGKVLGQLQRDFNLIKFFKKNKIDVAVCFGPTSVISARMCGVPYLAFDDDYEYKIPFYHANLLATKHIYPDFIDYEKESTIKYKGFKELAYLHPNYLDVNKKILSTLGLIENEYVFIREISNTSLNYGQNNSILKDLIPRILERKLKVVMSIENDNMKDHLPDDCVFLKEPVPDLYSIIKFALFAISSGDSVARESSLLGVPSIYTGGRKMLMNEPLIENNLMFESNNVASVIKHINKIDVDIKNKNKIKIETLIEREWEDTTSIIIREILNYE